MRFVPAAALVVAAVTALAGGSAAPPRSIPHVVAARRVTSSERIGTSVQGRPIGMTTIGVAAAARTALVIGCIHGDECAGRAIVARLAHADPATFPHTRLLLVGDLNPDGFAHRTRQNAHGVDLNRNGAVGRRYLGPRGTRFYAGQAAFSEPESRAIRAVILRERPTIVVWYHQPLTLIDAPERGSDARARRYARMTGLPFRPLAQYPGSLSRWTNVRVRRGSSFVVELGPGRLSAALVRRHAGAVLDLVRRLRR